MTDGERGARGVGLGLGVGRWDGFVLLTDFVGDDCAFEAPGAHLAPACNDHAFDEVVFDFVAGFHLLSETSEEARETFFRFGGEDDRAGEEPVFGGIA